jgi:hypothetical protein
VSESYVPRCPNDDSDADVDVAAQALPLKSLSPNFNVGQHRFYYDLLARAVAAEDVTNIALTGAYGTGKSSVIRKLTSEHKNKTVLISLATLVPKGKSTPDEGRAKSESERSPTNHIQKEIVKQLLYRLPPRSVPKSRFHRLASPNNSLRWSLAGAIAIVVILLLAIMGVMQDVVQKLYQESWRQWILYILCATTILVLARVCIAVGLSRASFSGDIKAGGATVTLSRQSDTYFDEYLDEIVYFFQASRRNIVVIEDLDRFEDVEVFDTLRTLNSLLNHSGQLRKKVTFVYAIRDSVFENIGSVPEESTQASTLAVLETDKARSTLERASRTKFFDIIIPIVPFLSADNAQDVLSQILEDDEFRLDPTLLRTVARHVVDMRLLHNIRNEFLIYRDRLITSAQKMPGITDEMVFALVVYKNTHLADFERIRSRSSSLDVLYGVWRNLIGSTSAHINDQLSELRQASSDGRVSDTQAQILGKRYAEFLGTLQAGLEEGDPGASVTAIGPVGQNALIDANAWTTIANGERQATKVTQSNGRELILSSSAQELAALLNVPLGTGQTPFVSEDDIQRQVDGYELSLEFLRHHSWRDLFATETPLVAVPYSVYRDGALARAGESNSFTHIVDEVLESDLARDLVRQGYLTSHFALYSASYYGRTVGPEAMEYIRRSIEPGIADFAYELSELDVAAVLEEHGAQSDDNAPILRDASVLNVSVLDYLLTHRMGAAKTVARQLSALDARRDDFLKAYVAQGKKVETLFVLLAAEWDDAVRYVTLEFPGAEEMRVKVLDDILRNVVDRSYNLDLRVGEALQGRMSVLSSLTEPESAVQAMRTYRVFAKAGGKVLDMSPLNALAQRAVIDLELFEVTYDNLRIILPSGVLALDKFRHLKNGYRHIVANVSYYLRIVKNLPGEAVTVSNASELGACFQDVLRYANKSDHVPFLEASPAGYAVEDILDVEPLAWPSLAEASRAALSFGNVNKYYERYGFDAALSTWITRSKVFVGLEGGSVQERTEFAYELLASAELMKSSYGRVRAVASLNVSPLDPSLLTPEPGDLMARLVKRRLVEDDARLFSPRLMVDWGTLEKTIISSREFHRFVSPELLQPQYARRALLNVEIPKSVRLAVVSDIESYLVTLSLRHVRELAAALIQSGWSLPYKQLEALRAYRASPTQLINLAALSGDKLSAKGLVTLFTSMGGDYAKIAAGGRGRPSFVDNEAHRQVLARFVGVTCKPLEYANFKKKGPRIVAPLVQ